MKNKFTVWPMAVLMLLNLALWLGLAWLTLPCKAAGVLLPDDVGWLTYMLPILLCLALLSAYYPTFRQILRALRQVYPASDALFGNSKAFLASLGLFLVSQAAFAQGGPECPAPANFNLMTPCYANGSRAANANEPIIVLWNHTASRGTAASKEILANYGEVGTVWGLAWHAQTKKLYAAAFLKRHADLSPDGLGAIYEIDLTTPTTAGAGTPTLWMNLNSTTHLGAGATLFPSETAANRGLGASNAPSYDLWAFNRVGKEGLGDIDISADGTTMYVMDLTNRQVLEINMATKTVTNRYAVNTPAGYPNANDRRPFAVKHHNGQLYIGVVGSAESSYNASNKYDGRTDLRATIMRLNAGTFTTVFTIDSMGVEDPAFPGNVFRVTSYRGNPSFGTGLGWYPNFTTDIAAPYYSPNDPNAFIQHPVPLISDIEFQNNGHMVIGIMDWTAHRYGYANYMPDPAQTDTRLKSAQAHGDVIQARWNGAAWVKEPGLGQFYDDMQAIPDPVPSSWPDDTYVGGLVVTDCNGTELAVANMQDPFTTNEGGVVWMRTSDGFMQTHTGAPADPNKSAAAVAASRLRIFTGAFGKAAGLGDMVAMFLPPCALSPADLTLSGLTFGPGSAPMSETVTTNGGGNLLPESNVAGFFDNASSEGPLYTFCTEINQPVLPLQNPYTHLYNGSANGLSATVALRIAQVVQAAGFNSTTGFGAGNNTVVNFVALQLAVWNAIYDTDYSVSNGAGTFYSTTNNNGAIATANGWLTTAQTITAPTVVVHELHNATGQDLLKVGNPPATVIVAAAQPTCSGAGSPNNGGITISNFTNQRYQYSQGVAFNSGAATPASITAIPVGGVIVSNLPNTSLNYTVRIYDATDDNCYVDQVVSITAVTCSSCPGNVLTNPSYETGDFTGWTITPGYGPGNDDVLLNSTPPGPFTNVQGSYYGVIISDNMNNPNVLHQDIAATPGTVANLSVYAAVHNPANNSEIKLQFLNAGNTVLGESAVQVDEDVDISGAFQLYNLSGTAPTGTTKVRVLASTSANTYSNGGPSFKTDGWCLTLTTLPTCCAGTNLLGNPSFESGTFTADASIIDPNNADLQTPASTTYWESDNSTYWVNSPGRATDGNRFMYVDPQKCVYRQMTIASNVLVPGQTYTICMDVAGFNQSLPNGGVGNVSPVFEIRYYDASFVQLAQHNFTTFTDMVSSATVSTVPISGWNNLNWRRLTASVTIPAAPGGAVYIAPLFSNISANGSGLDLLVDNVCVSGTCVTPAGINFNQSPATCASVNTPANNGSISITGVTNGTHYGISTLNAVTYNGPTTIAGATAITLPQTIASGIPNTGGTYIVRVFNGADGCFTDITVTAPTVNCNCPTPPCGGTTVTPN